VAARDRDAAARVPDRVSEIRPTPLQAVFIPLSVVALVCGVVAITALELGIPPGHPLVRVAVLIGTPLLVVVGADAIVRVWRSARAWASVDRGRAAVRVVWIAAMAAGLLVAAAGSIAILSAP